MNQKKYSFDLDTPILTLRDQDGETDFTLRDAVLGIQVFGSNGSGKSSGSGRLIAMKYLASNFSGIVLTCKTDEKDQWIEYCQLTGRMDDLVIVEPGGDHAFNFLEYLSSKKSGSQSITGNIVETLRTVIEAGDEKSDGKGADDGFWRLSLDMLVSSATNLCQLAYGKVTIQLLYDIVLTAPQKGREISSYFKKAYETASRRIRKLVDVFIQQYKEAGNEVPDDDDAFNSLICDHVPEAAQLKLVDQFFMESYKELADKTKSIVSFSFTNFLYRLMQEPVHSLFCRRPSTFTPEDCIRDGKIVLLNIPVKEYYKTGRDIQVAIKYIFQQAWEARNIKENERPLFIFADESQWFIHPHDALFQATARSCRICTVYLTQNIDSYFANMGGAKSEYRVNMFLATLGTKIFHANTGNTNKWASELIGDGYAQEESRTATISGNFSTGRTTSWRLERIVRPEQFVSLKTGGPANNLCTEAYIHKQGNAFHNGFNHIKATFKPNINTQS